MSFQSHAARLTCNAEKLSFSFGGSNTIDFLQTAMKYQDFDFTSVKNVGDMQKVVKHKKALKSMYDMYKDSPFIWGETYQKKCFHFVMRIRRKHSSQKLLRIMKTAGE